MSKLKLWNSSTEAVLWITFLLIILGTLNVFSASFVEAGQKLDDGYYNLGSWIEKAAKLHNK